MNKKIGGIIYVHRKIKGITQEELGRELSVSGTAVSKWERGITYPDIEIFLKMADYFQVLVCSDENIKTLIRNVDNVTLVAALSGASGSLCKKFLSNISDKLLYFINQDIKNCDAGLKEIIDAQKEMLQLAVELNLIEV